MKDKNKKFALLGDSATLLGFLTFCTGIALGIAERYRSATLLLLGGLGLLCVAMGAYRGIRRKTELVLPGDWEEREPGRGEG